MAKERRPLISRGDGLVRVVVLLPRELAERLDADALAAGQTRSAYIRGLLARLVRGRTPERS